MLASKRRFQGPILAMILGLVMLGGLIHDPWAIQTPGSPPASVERSRLCRLGPVPSRYCDEFDAKMNYAGLAPYLHSILEYELGGSSSPRVYIGRDKHLFYAGEATAAQSAGAIYRQPETLHFVEMTTILHRELGRRGTRLLVAIPPNAQSIAVEDLPSWSQTHLPVEYDLALTELRKRGIDAVDLKAGLLSAKNGEALYRRTDTHWTMRGAVLAFNMTMSAGRHPEWRADPNLVLAPAIPTPAGDLARFMGLQRFIADSDAQMRPASQEGWKKTDILRSPPYAGVFDSYSYDHASMAGTERILILGDSFTQEYWLPLFLRTNAERIGWMHHAVCGFAFADIDRFNPTLVILAPTERSIPCPLAAWPTDMARE